MLVFVCYALLLCVLTTFAIILTRENRAGCFILMLLNVSNMWLLHTMPWTGLQFVIGIFL